MTLILTAPSPSLRSGPSSPLTKRRGARHSVRATPPPQPPHPPAPRLVATTAAVVLTLATGLTWSQSAHAADALPHLNLIHHHSNPVLDLAEDESFWANVVAYVRYFFSVLLGTAYMAVKPIQGMMSKNPVSAVAVVAATALLVIWVTTTIKLMIGVDESFTYEASSMVTNRPI